MEPGEVGQAATFFVRYDGANGSHTTPAVIDNQANRSPGVPGHLRGRRHPARDLVGQPPRLVLQRLAADRQLRQSAPRCRLSTCSRRSRPTRAIPGPGQTSRHGRVTYEPELRAVRQPRRAVRRRLSLGHVARRHRLRRLDRLAEHRPGHGSARDPEDEDAGTRRRRSSAASPDPPRTRRATRSNRGAATAARTRAASTRTSTGTRLRRASNEIARTTKGRRKAPLRFPPFEGEGRARR